MKEIKIDELAYLIKQAKENGQPQPIFFLGAGASVTGNIPLARDVEKHILDQYSDNPFIEKRKPEERTYADLMECLLPHQRNELLKRYIDDAKINVTHIYLAQLLKNGFVDYVLTVNFDNLMLRALALFNEFPSTYDMAILKDLTTTTFKEKSVVYLHGQHHGLWLLNTEEEMKKVQEIVPRIFDSIKNGRPWVFIGYSASDPVFEHVKGLGRFDNGLYWVGYRENEPDPNVKEFLSTPNTNAHYIKGYDADAFMLKLNESLGMEQPEIFNKPFTSLQIMLTEINDIDDEDHFLGVKERLEIAKKDVKKCIDQYENNENVIVEEKEQNADRIKKKIIDQSLSGKYDELEIANLESEVRVIADKSSKQSLADLFLNWGNSLLEKASLMKSQDVFFSAFEKFKRSIQYNPELDSVFHSWGWGLGSLAEITVNNKENLYLDSFTKYQRAVEINPLNHEAFNNWGYHIREFAELKTGKERELLFEEAATKFQLSLEIEPHKLSSINNLGGVYLQLAVNRKGEEQAKFFNRSLEKFEKALRIDPENHDTIYNLACYYAVRKLKAEALSYLEKSLSKKESSIEFIMNDKDWKDFKGDKKFQDLIKKYSD